MIKIILTFILLLIPLVASEKLVFGAIAIVEPHLLQKKLEPLIKHLQNVTGKKIVFKTGYDYSDSIKKFANGSFDIGLIGPSPYVKVQKLNPNSIKIIAGLKNKKEDAFRSVIISKKGSSITKLEDLNKKNFAFGSPDSTLSYYLPMYMLTKKNIISSLNSYDFLGRHDRVAQYVIMGKYDAGALKTSVAAKYSKYIQVVAQSQAVPDFMIVASSTLDKEIFLKIQNALLEAQNIENFSGFEARRDSEYNHLRVIMKEVDESKKRNEE